jgi:outer membrane receptor for ferric coprogen and ferric-rhodotorulic acid
MPRLMTAAEGAEPTKCNLKIDSQPLGTALQEFASQCAVQIIFFSQITEGLRAPSLHDSYTVSGALQTLLSGSHLTFRVINPKTIEILPLTSTGPPDKASGHVEGGRPKADTHEANDRGQDTQFDNTALFNEIVVDGTAEGLVATRTETPLREIPQTLSIISSEQIRQENYLDLGDALADAVGITAQRSNSLGLQLFSRGFEVTTFHLDGGAALNSFDLTTYPFFGNPDLGEFDRIEVLRGADGLFGGEGNPGATINLIRKRALSTPQLTVSVSGGSWDDYRAEVDATGPLGFDGALRGRLDGELLAQQYFYNAADRNDAKIFGVLEFDLSSQTLLAAGGSIQWVNARPVVDGLPRDLNDDDPHLPRSTGLTFEWSSYDTRTREIYLQLTQRLSPGWKLKVNATSWDQTSSYDIGAFSSGYFPLLYPNFQFTPRPNTLNQLALDTTLTGSLDVLGRRVYLAVGADLLRFDGRTAIEYPNNNSVPSPINVYAYSPAAYPDPRFSNQQMEEDDSRPASDQRALFGSVKVELTSALSLIGGARVSRDSASTVNFERLGAFSGSGFHRFEAPTKSAPYAGVVYSLDQHYSLYASYAEVYQSNGFIKSATGSFLPPIDGANVEIGLKGAWHDNTLNATLALYGIEQKGLPLQDLAADATSAVLAYGCCYTSSGVIRSKGADLELNGQLAPGWLVGTGYTYSENYGNGDPEVSGLTPRHLFKFWTSKELAGSMQRWTVGGNVKAQSAMSAPYVPCPSFAQADCLGVYPSPLFKTVQGSYAIVGLRVSYAFDSHWRAALNANNIFDRIYYQTLGTPYSPDWYGEPRAFTLRIDGRY